MGGGDLNLKKSWHPQTMKNIERVWKAEKKHEAERKKIEELQKELKEERNREEMTRYAEETGAIKKRDDRLDWMYQGPAGQVSRDEYLLGRPIDKQITDQYKEPESGPSAETGLLPGSIFNPTTPASNLDLAAKIREDPLFEIRKCEEEKKRKVLTNPMRIKTIREKLRQILKKDKKKKRKKEKKEKRGDKERRKEKKHKRRRSDSDEEDEKKHRSSSQDVFSSTDTKSRSHHLPGYGLQIPAGRPHRPSDLSGCRRRSRSPPPHCSNGESRSYSSSYSSSSRRDDDMKPRAASPHRERNHRLRNPVSKEPLILYPLKTTLSSEDHPMNILIKQTLHQLFFHLWKLSAEELECRRREMMDQAKQREEDRENNVKRYKRQDEQEKQREQNVQFDPHSGFIHNMKLESAATSSLEDRVKRNIHSIQRTPASLDNFMKR